MTQTLRAKEFYDYLKRREAIRLARLAGKPWPWTADPILQKYRFTNVKRLHDRTTQELLTHYEMFLSPSSPQCRGGDKPGRAYLLNAATARYFGRWEFKKALGWLDDWDPHRVRSCVELRQASGEPVFTAAYVISNMGQSRPKVDLVLEFLGDLWNESVAVLSAIQDKNSWRDGIKRMQEIRGYGGSGFMAKEILLDTMLVPDIVWDGDGPSDRNTWCPAGPGAQRGCRRILGESAGMMGLSLCLPIMLELLAARDQQWPEGPLLELHDIQFGLCEFDKYERARLHEGKPKREYRAPR